MPVEMTAPATPPEVRAALREQSALSAWLWAPVTVLRTALITVYIVSIYAGVLAAIAGIPLFELLELAPAYTVAWATILGVSAATAAVAASVDAAEERHWVRSVEKWAGITWVSVFGLYVLGLSYVGYHVGDPTRMFASAVAIMAWILPASRSTWLTAQAGKKRG